MIGQMAIAIALPGFSGLERLVIPTFLSGNRFYLQSSKMNKMSMWEVKKISRFLSTGHQILRTRIHATSSMSTRALSIKINNDRECGHFCSFAWI